MLLPTPSWINLEELIQCESISRIKPFNRDHLLYLISLFITIPANNKKHLSQDGFICLNSTILQKHVHNYRQYLDFLIEKKVIIQDGKGYSKGNYSKKFKLCIPSHKAQKVSYVQVSSGCFKRKLALEWRIPAEVKNLEHLTKWLSKLSVTPEAFDYIALERSTALLSNEWEIDTTTLKRMHPVDHEFYARSAFERINNGLYGITVDAKGERLHTPITNLKKCYRQFLVCEDEPLVAVDIKNSQPYLSLTLLNVDFWQTRPQSPFALFWKGRKIRLGIPVRTIIMLVESLHSIHYEELTLFKNLVIQGQLYEYFAQKLSDISDATCTREEAKKLLLSVLYSGNNISGEYAEEKKIFKNSFPTIFKILCKIKKRNYKVLAWLLQQLESYIVLRVICKKIAHQYPKIPLFTIHDSIATTPQYVALIEGIMSQELISFVASPPSLIREKWTKS